MSGGQSQKCGQGKLARVVSLSQNPGQLGAEYANSEGKDGNPFVMGLLDVDTLRQKHDHDDNLSGENDNLSGVSQSQVGQMSLPHRHRKKRFTVSNNKVLDENNISDEENSSLENNFHSSSYHTSNYGTSHRGESL